MNEVVAITPIDALHFAQALRDSALALPLRRGTATGLNDRGGSTRQPWPSGWRLGDQDSHDDPR